MVSFHTPMLLSTARDWRGGDGWALEPKWDGFRMVAAVNGGRVRCWSRRGTDLTSGVGDIGVYGEFVRKTSQQRVIRREA